MMVICLVFYLTNLFLTSPGESRICNRFKLISYSVNFFFFEMLLPEISDLFKSELIVFRLTTTIFGTLKWWFPFISPLSWIPFPKSYTSFFDDFFFSFGETSHPVTSWEKEWLGSKLLRCYITENVIYNHIYSYT